MPTLKVDLQEGFSGETVVALLNGREVYRGAPRTRMQIGFADSRSFDLPPQHLTLEVVMPDSGVSQSLESDLVQDAYVGVTRLPDGTISLHSSSEPFRYL